MGRPKIMPFDQFTDAIALDAVTSILKTEKNTTSNVVIDRLRKRVNEIDASNEDLFVARGKAALATLASQGKITLVGETVAVVVGKRGRPRKVIASTANA